MSLPVTGLRCVALALLVVLVEPVSGAVYTWDGSVGGLWNDSTRWLDEGSNPGGTPWLSLDDVANVNSGSVAGVAGVTFQAQLNLNAGAQLQTSGSGNWPTAWNVHLNGGKIINGAVATGLNGTAQVNSHSYVGGTGETWLNILFLGSADLEKVDSNVFRTATTQDSFAGRWILSQGEMWYHASGLNTGTAPFVFRNNSKLVLRVNSTAWAMRNDINGSGVVSVGNNTATNALALQGVTLSPGEGASAGILTLQNNNAPTTTGRANVTLGLDGSERSQLVIDVVSAGTTPGIDHDALHLLGASTLTLAPEGADLVVRVAAGLLLEDMVGKTLTIVQSNTGLISGTFASVMFQGPLYAQTVTYNPTSITLSDWVPEPSTLALLGISGITLLSRRRRGCA